MKTEQLKEWGLTEEQIKQVFAENGKDIEREKAKTTDLTEKLRGANDKISDYEMKITSLQSSSQTAEQYKTELDSLKRKIEDEKAEAIRIAKEQEVESEISNRFDSIIGENTKFVNDLTRDGVFRQFKSALGLPENKGKGDKDIYEALTRDKEGIFANPHSTAIIPPAGAFSTGDKSGVEQAFARINPNIKLN